MITRNPRIGIVEEQLRKEYRFIAGIDEVGRGAIAGPLYTACVLMDYFRFYRLPADIRNYIYDSKQLTSSKRKALVPVIQSISYIVGIGISSVKEIFQYGLTRALSLAIRRALFQCSSYPIDILLVDGCQTINSYSGLQKSIVKGDQLCYSIAAASILAKYARDFYMRRMAKRYFQYGFDTHVGYATSYHQKQIKNHGPCLLHRLNFAPFKKNSNG